MRVASDKTILIAGPTASGKSALALALAERFGGIVINADSMQVYAELRILTARPTPEDEARAPHALYGVVPAREAYSVGRFVRDVDAALADARESGLRPILVGGTGLYFKALLEGLSPVPAVDETVRSFWRGEAERSGTEAVHAVLTARDPMMAARLKAADTQRIVRALEVLDSSGKSLAHWQAQPGVPLIDGPNAVRLVLQPDRQTLQARAEARFERMVDAGALEEAAQLAARQLDHTLPAMRAIGVAPMIAAAAGVMRVGEAIEQAQIETRQYIKRQETWLKRNMIAWHSTSTQSIEHSLASAIAFIQS
jgi:tRNA dimethylallyltransferase